MTKNIKLKIFWISIAFALTLILAYLGIYAIKKGFTITMASNFAPAVRCEIYVTPNGESERLIFSNLSGREYIHNDWQLYSNTSTLKYTPRMQGTIGYLYTMRVVNYTTDSYVYVSVTGGGVTENAVVLNPYNNVPEEADADILLISAVSAEFNINFSQVCRVTPTFTNVAFDMTYANNTLIKYENNYYIMKGENLNARIIATATLNETIIVMIGSQEYAVVSEAVNNGITFNKPLGTINIPSNLVNNDITIYAGVGYLVTLNSNGGTCDLKYKYVTLSEAYGALPTPTRSGYTFQGWNGCNLLSLDMFYPDGTNSLFSIDYINYTITWDDVSNGINGYIPCVGEVIGSFQSYTGVGGTVYACAFNSDSIVGSKPTPYTFPTINSTGTAKMTFWTRWSTDAPIGAIRYLVGPMVRYASVPFTANAFEPYYILPTTNVVQTADHTLTAKWA